MSDRTLIFTPGGQAQFRFPFERGLIEELKRCVPGVTWNGSPKTRAWTIRTRPANIRAIGNFAREHGFAGVEAADAERSTLFTAVKETMVASRAESADFALPATLRGELRPFQVAGVAYAVQQARGCLIADEMGVGKTVEAIATLETLNAFPAVIVCPASLKYNWERELQAWLPHRRAAVTDGAMSTFSDTNVAGKSDIGRPDVIVINYDILARHVDALRTFLFPASSPERHRPPLVPCATASVVFDEGHLLKTPKCARTLAAKKLRRGVGVRLLLTGTPVLNRPSELIAPLCVLGRLDDLGGFDYFRLRYCGPQQVQRRQRGSVEKVTVTDYSGASNLAELAGRLRATCMVRRRKADVLPELPARQVTLLPVDLRDSERAEYDRAQRDVLAWIARRAGRDPEFRAAIGHLDEEQRLAAVLQRAQAAADRAAQAEELVKIEALKQISARGKLAAAEEWIANSLETEGRLVVFAWHAETLRELARRFDAPVIDGDTPTAERQRIVDRFQRGEIPVLFLNLQAGGVGLTLTAASNALVLELPWTPALLDQAIDRLHRIGQRAAVNAWLMMGRRTIDYPIWQMLQKKRTTAETATR